ncbi:SH3 domain-containing protein [Helicobacter sp.]|uniref:SH3 domain-containing protein n=1 Tax=Helicobacter sp. TaxID=218 RepID=UPI002A748C70|nr:SH3 domain-containing protein [Helicobacter sp.]MDY2584823.1 SH3 domain-containing protein [Helicobacter sp.]
MLRIAMFCVGLGVLVLMLESKTAKQAQNLQEKICFYVQANALNVRQAPNTQAQILQTLSKGAKVCEYFGVENGFLRLASGYVSTKYLSLHQRVEKPKLANASVSKKEAKILLTSTQKTPKEDDLQLARLAIFNQDYTKAKTLALKSISKILKTLQVGRFLLGLCI